MLRLPAGPFSQITGGPTDGAGGGGSAPGGSGTELQYRFDATTFGGIPGSSVSGSIVTFGGVTVTGMSAPVGATDWFTAMRGSVNAIGTMSPTAADDGEYQSGLHSIWSVVPTGDIPDSEIVGVIGGVNTVAADAHDIGYLFGSHFQVAHLGDGDVYEQAAIWAPSDTAASSSGNFTFLVGIESTVAHMGSGLVGDGYALYAAVQGDGPFTRASGLFIERMDNTLASAVAKYAIFYNGGGTGTFTVDTAGIVKAAGYKSSDGSTGATVTTCTAFKNGLCVSGT